MNKEGKCCIMKTFEARFKRGFDDWNIYKNKYDNCRKKYRQFMQLTQNRTGLGYDEIGRIQMSDDWWNEREKECHVIRKSTGREVPNMDMLEEEFGGVVVTATKGWNAQHGEASLSSIVGGDDGDEADSVDISAVETQALEIETQPQMEPQAQPHTEPQTQTQAGSSRAKRKRKEKDVVVEGFVKRT